MAPVKDPKQKNDGDGYFSEDMKVDVGDFSFDALDASDEEESKDSEE